MLSTDKGSMVQAKYFEFIILFKYLLLSDF